MTQEEKAKAYDKLREKIAVRFGTNVSEEIFSEFEESEDEKIRKDIIDFVRHSVNKIPAQKFNKYIVWLEKQNNNKLNTTNIKSCIEMILTDADEQRFKDYNTNLAVCLAWLKRQGEEKSIDWSDNDRTMAFTLMRDVDQMTCISKEAKDERIGWLNSLDEKFISEKSAWNKDD